MRFFDARDDLRFELLGELDHIFDAYTSCFRDAEVFDKMRVATRLAHAQKQDEDGCVGAANGSSFEILVELDRSLRLQGLIQLVFILVEDGVDHFCGTLWQDQDRLASMHALLRTAQHDCAAKSLQHPHGLLPLLLKIGLQRGHKVEAELLPNAVRPDAKEVNQRVQFSDVVHHWCSRHAEAVLGVDHARTFGCLRRSVLDTLGLVQDDAIPERIRVDESTTLSFSGPSIWVVLFAECILLQFLDLRGQAAVRGDDNVVVLEVSEILLFACTVVSEHGKRMAASLDLLLDLLLPLSKQCYRGDDERRLAPRVIRLSRHKKRQHLDRFTKAHVVSENAALVRSLLTFLKPS